ncbi:unnamed protein product, partial [marine sediment metagenome]
DGEVLGKLKSKFVNWLLKDIHLDEIHIGEHSVVVSVAGIKIEEALADDLTVCGTTCDGTAGENLAQFDVCYLKNDGKYWKADADAVTSMPVIAMATAAITADASGVFLLLGFVRKDAWAWAMGGLLYADEGTGGTIGGMTQTAPAGAGDQVQVIGIAITADIIYLCPCLELVEVPA